MLTITLTRNRSNSERYVRLITYTYYPGTAPGEDGGYMPTGHSNGNVIPLEWGVLDRTQQRKYSTLDNWPAHVTTQVTQEIPQATLLRARLIAAGLIKPKDATKWKRSLKAVLAAVPQ